MYDSALHPLTPARCLADLKWLLQSNPLLSLQKNRFSAAVQSYNALQTQQIIIWLSQVDPQHLYRTVLHTMPKKNVPIRLGRYAETLLLYFLQHSKLFELLAANVPLRSKIVEHHHKDHTTIGEIDYLLRDTDGLYWHWELAIKFYLYYPKQDSFLSHTPIVANDFKGPAGVDTLALKLNKMFDKQLHHQPPPPYNPDLSKIWHAAAYTRGYLFYPYSRIHSPDIYACDALNLNHGRGWWLTIDEFKTHHNIGDYFVHLPRLHWLAPFNSGDFLSHSSTVNDLSIEINTEINTEENINTKNTNTKNINTENINIKSIEKYSVLSKKQTMIYLRYIWQNAAIQAGQLVAQVVQEKGSWIEKSRGFIMPTALI